MAISEGKTRFQVTFGDELLEKMDRYCKQTGLSRSAYLASLAAQSLNAYDQIMNFALEAITDTVKDSVESE